MSEIRTDLAAEAREVHASLPGVIAREDMLHGFPVTRVEVQTAEEVHTLALFDTVEQALAMTE